MNDDTLDKNICLGFVGAHMVLSMKLISLAFDFGSGAIIDLPNIFEFMGYSFHVGTVIFGPWVSYHEYSKSLLIEKLPLVSFTEQTSKKQNGVKLKSASPVCL